MTDTATAIGPVVRMCEDPACNGWQSCPSANPLMGLADNLPPSVTSDVAVALFIQNLSLAGPKDSAGVARILPDGAGFVLHKGERELGGYHWTAIYAGPAKTIDEVLADSPDLEANYHLVTERLTTIREAGLLDAAVRWRDCEAAGG